MTSTQEVSPGTLHIAPALASGLKAKVSHLVAPFVVVSNPGTLFERIEDYCSTFQGALTLKSDYDEPCDVMKVLPSGRLTTEF